MTKQKKVTSKLERYLTDTMFEKALFSDLCLVFIHPAFPFAMRFNVHKSIMSQSPFLCKLLENMDTISTKEMQLQLREENETDSSDSDSVPSLPNTQRDMNKSGVTTLTIDLSKALTHCGFILAPFQHIVRRKWQKAPTASASSSKTPETSLNYPLLSSHIRFVLKWMYSLNKYDLITTMEDDDTLRILFVSVLLDIHDLTQACVYRYTRHQLSLDSIMRDLETICQLPHGHRAYLQLRDAALLLLMRMGPEHASRIAMLPVDYMADVLSADLLFVTCEFERYCLLRAVLMAFMQSVGKITWTKKGPVDQYDKRLSGFVRPSSSTISTPMTADTVRSRKRKRIPSQELQQKLPQKRDRLSFTALVPFEKLMADVSSGGVIDKASVLSYLLRTTVYYSNMTFEQLTTVRQDGIVDEGIVFRALWQREALERVLFPLTYHHQQTQERPQSTFYEQQEESGDRSAALDEYFDVDHSDAQEKRRRLLLGTPKFRFKASVLISPPSEENGWTIEQRECLEQKDLDAFDDDDESDGSVWSLACSDHEEEPTSSQVLSSGIEELGIGHSSDRIARSKKKNKMVPYKIYKKMFYSEAETILGISYRVQIEAQVMPRHRLYIKDNNEQDEEEEALFSDENNPNENVIVCRFELQRDMKRIPLPTPLIQVKTEKNYSTKPSQIPVPMSTISNNNIIPVHPPTDTTTTATTTTTTTTNTTNKDTSASPNNELGIREKTKIHYWIHCLNRHEGITQNDRIDPEDRILIAATEQREREDGIPGEMEPGYVGQVLVDAEKLDSHGVTIDATVALEIFGFQKV